MRLNPKSYVSPIMGAEAAENGTFRASLRHPVSRELMRLSDRRVSYGEAFDEANNMVLAMVKNGELQ